MDIINTIEEILIELQDNPNISTETLNQLNNIKLKLTKEISQ